MTYCMGPDTAPGSGTTWWEYREKHGHVPICCLKCPRYNRDCDGHPIPGAIGKD